MRLLKPNPRTGVITATKGTPWTGGSVNAYRNSSRALKNLDHLMKGNTPEICVSRKQGGIGDVLMTLPTVKAISEKYKTQVDYATDMGYLDGALPKVLIGNPSIRNILSYKEIDPDKYHAVIDLTCPCIAHEKPGAPPINRVDLFARHACVHLKDTSIDYFIKPEEHEWAKKYLYDNSLDRFKLVLVQPFSSTSRRDAPVDKLKKSLAMLMKKDRSIRAIVIQHNSNIAKSDWSFSDIHTLNNYDVRHIAAIMHYSDLVLCPDSSVLHLANALRKKTVTLFGPTDPRARINYHPEAVAIWPGKNLKNYPLWYAPSPDGYICWKMLNEETITECCYSVLTDSALPQSQDLVIFNAERVVNASYEIL